MLPETGYKAGIAELASLWDGAWCLGLSYLCGSIPFGLLLGLLAGVDIRKGGSGNIGATNTLRLCGWRFGVPALLLDAAKGVAAVLVFGAWWQERLYHGSHWSQPALCGVVAIFGHTFPVWLRFKGGRGVATAAGVLGALMPWALAAGLAIFTLVVARTRYISLGSMTGALALALAATGLALWAPWLRGDPGAWPLAIFAWGVAGLVFLLHRPNIRRLRAGTENRLSFAKKA